MRAALRQGLGARLSRLRGATPPEAPPSRRRSEAAREAARLRAEARILVLGVFFLLVFATIAWRMATLAAQREQHITIARAEAPPPARADITDRKGRVLATNIETYGLYVQPGDVPVIDKQAAADKLVALFPDLDRDTLLARFDRTGLAWIKGQLSPEQMQAVRDIGDPGLRFGPRETRLYPNGALAAHVLGSTGFGPQAVRWAEIEGRTGIEKYLDARLKDPLQADTPVALSLDLTVQAATEELLASGMSLMNAKGAAAILMDVHTGELISIASMPDFDPNSPPLAPETGDPSESPLFNRAVLGRYELGSTFKIFTAAQAMEMGLVTADTIIDTRPPLRVGGWPVSEFQNHNYGQISLEQVIVKSSNRGTARVAMMFGAEAQKEFLRDLGFFEPIPVELVEARHTKPLLPPVWRESDLVTISYGHTLAASPLHLAAAYATIANGGRRVTPTLLRQDHPRVGERVMREQVARDSVNMLRKVVTEGTASRGEVPGYFVGGKTGTANKPRPTGGYYKDRVVNTFAAVFPSYDPKYVLVVTLDEPLDTTSGVEGRRSAGYTAVPVARQILARIAPLLGLRPELDRGQVLELRTE